MPSRNKLIASLLLLVVAIGGYLFIDQKNKQASYERDHPYDEISRREFHPLRAAGQFPAITEIPTRLVSEVEEDELELRPESLVLGVAINGESRAYPLNQLLNPEREIFNDRLGGKDIMPTW